MPPRRPALYALAVLPVAALALARPTCDPPAVVESEAPPGSYGRLAADLAAGRVTLAAATDAREGWYAGRPDALGHVRAAFPSGSDREAVARAVATVAVSGPTGAERKRVRERLEAEFRALFPDAGPLVFRETDGEPK